ncbi:ATP-binding protein [Streptomyces sp. JJ66]|uniref:ATP-binding protein n=1 Tax=Streptomyces sp. JJ66 TaxID=2803843 RepID=UPI001C56BC90|nr:ATP-binding protein [Streptomyces sp. JJ66]MBW1601493.1 ATP-binding protein [Streptomyces sp. JJ66]
MHPPTHRGPEDGGGRESHDSGALARTVQLVAGDYLLTVNPVDGSEVESCPPDRRPGPARRRTAEARAERGRAAVPPPPIGDAALDLPLLERDEERERLARLLARGRSVRLTGPSGAGRTALLAAVAADCADLAPDGVIQLSGYQRSVDDLLWELYTAVYDASRYRPEQAELLDALADIGAVLLLDDVEFGGAALDELLAATPECAVLAAVTPQVPAPSPHADLEEVFLRGISRPACVELLERATGRTLAESEADWAGDLWFESEGLPLRFVQAGALLRHRDAAGAATSTDEDAADADTGAGEDADDASVPALSVACLTAGRLAETLSPQGRETLRFAVALGGEVPQAAHLPALLDDQRADTALAELTAAGLATSAGPHYRLAEGVTAQLADAGYAEGTDAVVRTAAQHYAWWGAHPSVTPKRVAAESHAVLAALAAARAAGAASTAVRLAHTAAPVFAAAGRWSAWERALTEGQQAAAAAGEIAEEAYFHHERGVHALCTGALERARTELERAMELRGRLADRRGQFAGRRALALVADASGEPLAPGLDDEERAAAEAPTSLQPAIAVGAPAPAHDTATLPGPVSGTPGRRLPLTGPRRNVMAAAAGALLAALLGTVLTLTSVFSDGENGNRVQPDRSSSQQDADDDGFEDVTPPSSENADDSGKPGPSGSPESPDEVSPARPGDTSSPEEPSDDGTTPDDGAPDETSPTEDDQDDTTTGGSGGSGGSGGASGGTQSGGTGDDDNSSGPEGRFTDGGSDTTGASGGTDDGSPSGSSNEGSTEGGAVGGTDEGGTDNGGTEGGTDEGGTEGGGTDGDADTGGTGSPTATGPAPATSQNSSAPASSGAASTPLTI